MLDLENFSKVVLVDKNRWPLSRQLDADAGLLVAEKIEELGVGILRDMRISEIETEEDGEGKGRVRGCKFENGERMDLGAICFAVLPPFSHIHLIAITNRIRLGLNPEMN